MEGHRAGQDGGNGLGRRMGKGVADETRRVTLVDVAAEAGVSRATASLVLRDSPLVAEPTRAQVREAMAKLGYVYHRAAANMRMQRTNVVGLLIPEIQNPFFAELVVGIDEVLDEAGYVAFLANTAESTDRQARFLNRMKEQNVDGVAICPVADTDPETVRRMRTAGVPCVEALRHTGRDDVDYAGAAYAEGVGQAVAHLADLGHRRIAFVGGVIPHSATAERHGGFAGAMARAGLDADLLLRCPLSRRCGAEAIAALLDAPDPPTAVVCFNDVVAFGVMLGLVARGLAPGRDVAVVGMDDVPEAALSHPPLTTVSTSPRQVGREAAKLLLRRIAAPGEPAQRIVLPTRLVARGSTGPRARPRPDRSKPSRAALP